MVGREGFEPSTIVLKVGPEVAQHILTQTKALQQQLVTQIFAHQIIGLLGTIGYKLSRICTFFQSQNHRFFM
jgi:hypothetical protein